MAEGFAEHRSLVLERLDRVESNLVRYVDGRVDGLRSRLEHRLDAVRDDLRSDMRTGFGKMDAKLDDFISTQSAFNRWVMARLGRG